MAQETVASDPLIARRGLSREHYDALTDAGLLDGWPVELLEGVMVEVVPQGHEHTDAVVELDHYLTPRIPEPWRVRVQAPLAVSATSEPEPDLAVTLRTRDGHPRTAALAIEVAVTSQRTDLLHKPRLYAAAGVEQYWAIDLPSREVVVHTDPITDDAGSRYNRVVRLPWTTPLEVLGVSVDLQALLS